MEKTLRVLFFLVFSGLMWSAQAAANPPTVPGRLVLKLKPGQSAAALETAFRTLDASNAQQKFPRAIAPTPEKPGSVELRGIYQVQVPTTLTLDRARAVLLGTGLVEYVEPLYIRFPQYQPNDPMADSTLTNLASSQYYLKQIKAYQAWDVTRGDSSIIIGITDGGMRLTHEEFRRQIKYNYADPVNGADDDGDGYVDNFNGWDVANNDNDPGYDINITHGSMVAGVSSAHANNGAGIAGLGNKCRVLPLNIYPNTPHGSFAGVEAVVYAADHNCRVINMSWGAVGGYSRYEQDAMTYAAVNRDAVLVAAAGNTNADLLFYPASYEHVLSVSGVSSTDQKSPNATFGHRVDLVAPGVSILTVSGYHATWSGGPVDADYVAVGGTSFAAPLVAAAAALVRWQFPQFTAAQVGAQLRQTTDNIDDLPVNSTWTKRLGTGRLNVLKALTKSSMQEARVLASTFVPARTVYLPGDSIRLMVTVQNLLQPITDLTVTVTSLSPHVVVRQGSFAAGNLASLARTSNNTTPFRLAVATSGIPLNSKATLRYRLTGAGGFQFDQFVDIMLNPDYVVLDGNNMAVTLTSRSNLGYDNLMGTVGAGVTYRGSNNILSEGGLLLATSPTRVSDRLRTRAGQSRQSFFSTAQVVRVQPGPRADQEARAAFQDSIPVRSSLARSVGVAVRQRAFAWASPGRRDFVVLEYTLKNLTADTLKPLHAGLFMDWDMPTSDGTGRNAASWDSTRALAYTYSLALPAPNLPAVYAGVQLLRGGSPTVYSLDNNAPVGAPVRLADGFSPAEKFLTVSSGTTRRTAGLPAGADVSQVVGARLAKLAPGDSTTVTFAMMSAPSLLQLQAAADAASLAFATVLPTRPALSAAAFKAYPNPTTGPLQLQLPEGFGTATVQVLDMTGRPLMSLQAHGRQAETNLAGLAPGMYLVRAVGAAGVLTRAVVVR